MDDKNACLVHGVKEPNRFFLHLNEIEDGITTKDTSTAKLTAIEIENRKVSKKHYIVKQYFGLSHFHL
jgi:hypothetical protein